MDRDLILEGFSKLNMDSQMITAFEEGIKWLEFVQKRERILKEKRKNKAFIPTDFISGEARDWNFKLDVFYEKGFAVYSNGTFLVKAKFDYPAEWEGKKLDAKNEIDEVDYNYPNYGKVVPNLEDCTESTDFNRNDVKLKLSSSKSVEKLSREIVDMETIRFSGLTANRLVKFWDSFPDAKLYRQEDIHKAWMLKDGENLFVFIPFAS